jgi:hypothetical protein
LNLSSEDQDKRISQLLLDPSLNLLPLLNQPLTTPHQEETLLGNLLWIFANLLGELNPALTQSILSQTDLLDFLLQVAARYERLTPMLLRMIPWIAANIVRVEAGVSVETVQVVLRVMEVIVRDVGVVKSEKKRERVCKEVLEVIERVLGKGAGGSIEAQRAAVNGYIEQILDWDLQGLFEVALGSENQKLMEMAMKTYGQLLIVDDEHALLLFQKFP